MFPTSNPHLSPPAYLPTSIPYTIIILTPHPFRPNPHLSPQVLPIPYTVVLLIMGLIIGVILTFGAGVHVSEQGEEENIFVNSISQWVNM